MAKGERRTRAPRGATRRQRTVIAVAVTVLAAIVLGYFAYRAEVPHEQYNSDPPTSGPHLPYIAPWGVHTRPIVRELQVHNLEDGGVVVQYNCECPDLVTKLKAIVDKYDRHVILAPYPGMKHKIALTAWTRLDTLDELDEGRILRFIEAYRGIDHHK
jgi:hypothetical protein